MSCIDFSNSKLPILTKSWYLTWSDSGGRQSVLNELPHRLSNSLAKIDLAKSDNINIFLFIIINYCHKVSKGCLINYDKSILVGSIIFNVYFDWLAIALSMSCSSLSRHFFNYSPFFGIYNTENSFLWSFLKIFGFVKSHWVGSSGRWRENFLGNRLFNIFYDFRASYETWSRFCAKTLSILEQGSPQYTPAVFSNLL